MKRFALVTSLGTGDSKGATPQPVYDALKPVLIEKAKAEDRLIELGSKGHMEYTIVRPGGLVTKPATGTAVLTESKTVCGPIHREDVARLVCRSIFSDKAKNK